MKHLAQTGSWVAAAAALSATLNPGSASAAVLITGLDPSPTDPLTTVTSLNAISVGSDTFSNLITPTQGQADAALTVRGSADDPGFPSAADAVIDNDLTTGIGDIDDGVVRVLFDQTINDTNALADLFILDWGNAQDNAQNIRAIVGGTLAAPIYGGITRHRVPGRDRRSHRPGSGRPTGVTSRSTPVPVRPMCCRTSAASGWTSRTTSASPASSASNSSIPTTTPSASTP